MRVETAKFRLIGLVVITAMTACSETTIGSASGEYTEVTLPVLEARAEKYQGSTVTFYANLEGYRPYDLAALNVGPCRPIFSACLGLSVSGHGGTDNTFAIIRDDSPLFDEVLALNPERSTDVTVWGRVVGSGGWGVSIEVHKATFRKSFF